jgi:hypothetical protein
VFTKKRRQIGRDELLLLALSVVFSMFHSLVPPALLVVMFIAILGIYLIWTKM